MYAFFPDGMRIGPSAAQSGTTLRAGTQTPQNGWERALLTMEVFAYLLLILACLLFSAFFSGSETALLRVQRDRLEQDIKDARGPSAVAVRDMIESMPRLLVTILFGNNVVNILGASVASALAVGILGPRWGIIVATITMTFTVFVFCEILPKAIAAQNPRKISYLVAIPLYLIHQILRPLHLLYELLIAPMVRWFSGGAETSALTEQEELLRMARAAGDEDDKPDGTPIGIIGATARAVDVAASDIMVPRTEIVAFPVTIQPADLLEQLLTEGYTRTPIFEADIDRVLGVAHLKDLIHLVREDNGDDLRRILKPTLIVPERRPILDLFGDMQRAFVHLAIVQDEFGVTQGLVTQEDILEELVGEIRDEFDREELNSIRNVAEGRYQALGRIKVQDFNRATGESLDAEPGDTLAGVVFNNMGHMPRRGESIQIPGYEIVVTDVTRNRINQVQVHVRVDPTLGRESAVS